MVIEKKSNKNQVLTIIGALAIVSILAVVVVLVLMFNNREGYKKLVLFYKLVFFACYIQFKIFKNIKSISSSEEALEQKAVTKVHYKKSF